MKRSLHIIAVLITAHLAAQEAPTQQLTADLPTFRVLAESVVRQRDGGSVTFQRVEPPLIVAAAAPKAALPPTPDQLEKLRRMERKEHLFLSVSASVRKDGRTLLHWWPANGGERLQALSNVDFRLVAGIGSFETEKGVYSLFMGLGPDAQPLAPEIAALAKWLPADGRPAFVMPQAGKERTPAELRAVAAMEALHAYFEANREALIELHAQREVERAARRLAERDAPPPGPKHAVIHFWPLQPEQRAAIEQAEREKHAAAADAASAVNANSSRKGGVEP